MFVHVIAAIAALGAGGLVYVFVLAWADALPPNKGRDEAIMRRIDALEKRLVALPNPRGSTPPSAVPQHWAPFVDKPNKNGVLP